MNVKNIKNRPRLLALGLFCLSVYCLQQGTRSQLAVVTLPAAISQPMPERLSRFSLIAGLGGMRSVGADWSYIDALQYVGNSRNSGDGRYRRTYELYREVLWIDPYFHFAVLEGCSSLGWNLNRIDEALALLEAAIKVDPVFARYRLYYAALAYQKSDVDPRRVLAVLQDEVRRWDAPEMLLRMVGNLYMKHRYWGEARLYWQWLLQRNLGPETRIHARNKLAELSAMGR